MRILLHTCCAGCSCYPVEKLREIEGVELVGFWYNPNIHPWTEYQRRLMAMGYFAQKQNLPMIYEDEYALEEWLEATGDSWKKGKSERCRNCYLMRMKTTAAMAKEKGFDCFTTTLLYSRFQEHELIKSIGEELAREYGVSFWYQDFRQGWKEGIEISRQWGLYRQQYCGCIFSEKERYIQLKVKIKNKPRRTLSSQKKIGTTPKKYSG